MASITKLPAVRAEENVHSGLLLRVCAYCRVSTDEEDQLSSFVTQVEYYTSVIQENQNWEFAGIYADEGISGTTMWRRTEFNRMIETCRKRRVDLILTKSISRFARNVFESIKIIRELKSLGIAVYFEKERINTMTAAGELALTIYCSVAEEESASISKNIKWGNQKRMLNGTWLISSIAYGYRKDNEGELIPYPVERIIIERIHDEYLSGIGSYLIAKGLNRDGILSPGGTTWDENAVLQILKNPIYVGDLLCQKTFTEDDISHKRIKNQGEYPMYLYPDDHEGIISRDKADLVKNLMDTRCKINCIRRGDTVYQVRYPFSGRLICGECGHKLKRQIIKVTERKQYIRWCCKEHIRNNKNCSLTGVKEVCIEEAFIRLTRKLKDYSNILLEPLISDMRELQISKEEQMDIKRYNEEILNLKKQSHILYRHMSDGNMDSALFMQKSYELTREIQLLTSARDRVLEEGIFDGKISELEELIQIIRNIKPGIKRFDGDLFLRIIEEAVVTKEKAITFHLKSGVEFTEQLLEK